MNQPDIPQAPVDGEAPHLVHAPEAFLHKASVDVLQASPAAATF